VGTWLTRQLGRDGARSLLTLAGLTWFFGAALMIAVVLWGLSRRGFGGDSAFSVVPRLHANSFQRSAGCPEAAPLIGVRAVAAQQGVILLANPPGTSDKGIRRVACSRTPEAIRVEGWRD
jgi:hypothetical protein